MGFNGFNAVKTNIKISNIICYIPKYLIRANSTPFENFHPL